MITYVYVVAFPCWQNRFFLLFVAKPSFGFGHLLALPPLAESVWAVHNHAAPRAGPDDRKHTTVDFIFNSG